MLKTTSVACLILAATAATAPAQGPTDTQTQNFVLESGPIELGELIDRSASYLGWNILVNQQELAHCADQFKLQNPIETDRTGCEDLLTTMLATRGVVVRTLDQKKKLYEVISLHGPRARELQNGAPHRSSEEILQRPNLRMPVSTVLKLEHINANIAVNSLRPFFAQSGGGSNNYVTFGTAGSQSALMLTGLQDQVATAIRLVMQSDVPQAAQNNTMDLESRLRAMQTRIAQLEKELKKLKGK